VLLGVLGIDLVLLLDFVRQGEELTKLKRPLGDEAKPLVQTELEVAREHFYLLCGVALHYLLPQGGTHLFRFLRVIVCPLSLLLGRVVFTWYSSFFHGLGHRLAQLMAHLCMEMSLRFYSSPTPDLVGRCSFSA